MNSEKRPADGQSAGQKSNQQGADRQGQSSGRPARQASTAGRGRRDTPKPGAARKRGHHTTATGEQRTPPLVKIVEGAAERQRCYDVVKWRRAVLASELSPSAKVVALTLHEFMTWSKRSADAGASCFPSLDTLAAAAGMARATVARALGQLDECRFVTRDRSAGGQGRPTHYTATLPGEQSHSATVDGGGTVADTTVNSRNGDREQSHIATQPSSTKAKTFRASSVPHRGEEPTPFDERVAWYQARGHSAEVAEARAEKELAEGQASAVAQ